MRDRLPYFPRTCQKGVVLSFASVRRCRRVGAAALSGVADLRTAMGNSAAAHGDPRGRLIACRLQDLWGSRGAMIWSPLSNMLLYGKTADVAAAKAAGVRIGLGSDWSPSGSKNLLGELKVAKAVSAHQNSFSSREIVAMATRGAAEILNWDAALGSLEPGKRADIVVVTRTDGDPYDTLIGAQDADVGLVVINGVPRDGTPAAAR